MQRVSEALNISVSSITRIQNRAESNNNLLRSPGKKRHRKMPKTSDLTNSNKSDIRDIIYRMYSESKDLHKEVLKFFTYTFIYFRKAHYTIKLK